MSSLSRLFALAENSSALQQKMGKHSGYPVSVIHTLGGEFQRAFTKDEVKDAVISDSGRLAEMLAVDPIRVLAARDHEGTVLHWASDRSLKLLIDSTADLELRNQVCTVLCFTAGNLIIIGAHQSDRPRVCFQEGQTALQCAVKNAARDALRKDTVELLLQSSANINCADQVSNVL